MTLPDTSNSLIDQNTGPRASSWDDAACVFSDTHTWLTMHVIFTVNGKRGLQLGHREAILTFPFVKHNQRVLLE